MFGYRHQLGQLMVNFANHHRCRYLGRSHIVVYFCYFSSIYRLRRELKIRRRQLHGGSTPPPGTIFRAPMICSSECCFFGVSTSFSFLGRISTVRVSDSQLVQLPGSKSAGLVETYRTSGSRQSTAFTIQDLQSKIYLVLTQPKSYFSRERCG
jgi:hypothetical protein